MSFTEQLTHDAKVSSLVLAYGLDPILGFRQLLPHWFSRPIQWAHRGLIAILLRRADFLLNFTDPNHPEKWPESSFLWTPQDLDLIVRHFVYKLNPDEPNSPVAPIFRVKKDENGVPISIDMVLGQYCVFIIPRGFAKTTLVNAVNLYKTLFRLTKFTVYLSDAAPHAEDQLATIRRELATNERIIALFGTLKPDRSDDETWGAKGFETKTGVKFAARGAHAQIRGLNRFGDRPDTIVLDDVEDEESVLTELQREKMLSWFVGAVEPALDRANPSATIYAIGTMLDPKALLPTLAKSMKYTSVQFGAALDSGKRNENGTPILMPLWDDKAGMSLKALEKKKTEMAAVGRLYNFYLEFMSTHRDETKLKFRPEYIKHVTRKRSDFISVSIHIDPAISPKPDADYCCIAVVGQMENGMKHLCDFHAERGMPMSEQARVYMRMRREWSCTHHSCEATAYQAALAQVIRELMFIDAKTHGISSYFNIKEVWPAGRKVERVEGILQPLMAAGYLTFQKIWPVLETMFYDWPRGKLDGPDAIAGAIANLEPFAALSFGDQTQLEAQYSKPLHYEAPCAAGSGKVP